MTTPPYDWQLDGEAADPPLIRWREVAELCLYAAAAVLTIWVFLALVLA